MQLEIKSIDRPIAIAVMLFIILVLGFYLVAPKYQQFNDLQIKLSEKEAEFKGKAAYFLEVGDTFKKLRSYEEGLEKIDSALPSDPSIAFLIYFFQKKTLENGLIFQQVSFSGSSSANKRGETKEIHFSLGLLGSYSAFKNFLSSLEKSARLVEVESISFASQRGTEQIYPFKLEIKVHSY